MTNEQTLTSWILSADRDWLGDAYVTLYMDAPDWVANQVSRTFGKSTVVIWSTQQRSQTSSAAA